MKLCCGTKQPKRGAEFSLRILSKGQAKACPTNGACHALVRWQMEAAR